MAELCLKCFLETFRPNAYDRAHIVMSDDNEFCEGCLDCVPYVDHIGMGDHHSTPTLEDFVRVVVPEMKAGHKIACAECGTDLGEDDLAFAHETGECPYCHAPMHGIWIKKKERHN